MKASQGCSNFSTTLVLSYAIFKTQKCISFPILLNQIHDENNVYRSYSTPNPRGFVRLNSLEDDRMTSSSSMGQMPTTKSRSQIESDMPGAHFHAHQHTPQESKWFRNYHSDPLNHSRKVHQHRPMAKTSGLQMPYNLNTGQYECWQSQPHQTGSEQLFQVVRPLIRPELATMFVPTNAIVPQEVGHCISNLVGSMIQTMSSFCQSPLNPNARPFVPLNPNAAEFRPTGSGSCGSSSTTASETSSVVDSSEDHPSLPQPSLVSPETGPKMEEKLTPPQSQAPSPCVTPIVDEHEKEDILKSVCDRKGTPWVQQEQSLSAANLSEDSIETNRIQ